MDELEFVRNRRATEHHYGDVRRACERVGVTPPIFQSAIKKKCIDDLTNKEMLVIRSFIEVLDERKKEKEILKKSADGKRINTKTVKIHKKLTDKKK